MGKSEPEEEKVPAGKYKIKMSRRIYMAADKQNYLSQGDYIRLLTWKQEYNDSK